MDKSNLEQFRVERVEDELEIIEDDSPSMNSGKYSKRRERASRNGSTVVDISIPPPSFKPIALFLSRSLLF